MKNKQGLRFLTLIRLAIQMNYSIKGIVNGKVDVFVSPFHNQWFENGVMFTQGEKRFEGIIGLYENGIVKFGVASRDVKEGDNMGPNDFPTVNFINIYTQQENTQIFLGYNEGWCEGYPVDPWCYKTSFIAKFNFLPNEIQLLEVLSDVGLEMQLIESNNTFTSLGFLHDYGGLEAPYSYWYYYIQIIDNTTPANVETISNLYGFKQDFTILTDDYYGSYYWGNLIYIRPDTPNANLVNYSSDFLEILWQREEVENGNNRITTSTEISTNQGNHFVSYFRYTAYKIIDRITGNTVLENSFSFPITEILRKSNEELLFISDTQTNYYDAYSLDGEIQVGIGNNEIGICDQQLLVNFPNPFNPSTTIEFSIQNNSKVELAIYNIKGQKIKTLAQNDFNKGSHSIIWNGDNESGNPVSSGIYYYKLDINGKTEAVKKCLLMK